MRARIGPASSDTETSDSSVASSGRPSSTATPNGTRPKRRRCCAAEVDTTSHPANRGSKVQEGDSLSEGAPRNCGCGSGSANHCSNGTPACVQPPSSVHTASRPRAETTSGWLVSSIGTARRSTVALPTLCRCAITSWRPARSRSSSSARGEPAASASCSSSIAAPAAKFGDSARLPRSSGSSSDFSPEARALSSTSTPT